MLPIYYKQAKIAIIVHQIPVKGDSVPFAEQIFDEIATQKYPNTVELFAIVGTKSDVSNNSETEKIELFAKEKNCSYFKTSCMTGDNVINVFNTLTMKYLEILENKANSQKRKMSTPHLAKRTFHTLNLRQLFNFKFPFFSS